MMGHLARVAAIEHAKELQAAAERSRAAGRVRRQRTRPRPTLGIRRLRRAFDLLRRNPGAFSREPGAASKPGNCGPPAQGRLAS
jgi:hypothetical protein